jgi:cytosine deaminase
MPGGFAAGVRRRGRASEQEAGVISRIANARLLDGSLVDVTLRDDRIAALTPSGRGASAAPDREAEHEEIEETDAEGGLLLPAFIDTHVHLDKAHTRAELPEHDGTVSGAIRVTQAWKRQATEEDVRRRARAVIEAGVLTGTTRLRSHVDVDTIVGLTSLRGVLGAVKDCADLAEVQTIAFPQEGILRDPGTDRLMRQAMEEGADVVGGMPHWEDGEADQRAHVRFCFDLAQEFDADVDLHVDETDDGSVRTLAMVIEETEARGWQGRVTVGHLCALAAADAEYAATVIEGCARAGITVVANPVTNLVLQGRDDVGLVRRGSTRIRELLCAGVGVAFGQDCVDDAFYPFGRGDMLEVALISAHVAQLVTGEELLDVLDAVTAIPAAAWGIAETYGLREGARADLQVYQAGTWPEVLRRQEPPAAVWHSGRVVASTTIRRSLRPGPARTRRRAR